ncbi:hypothetical protein Pyn_38754 [Prunus yedoensis var. nudiflora]|uniref:Uncharacterized protein n=1 Tax=Prunus yedoensis var. nudiflora TaxID=2094558 RepID=A0A314XW00_PRUYE|nr:hypothetical protein Pyn_38754 [Prunus yedoensis var. nudiflora]
MSGVSSISDSILQAVSWASIPSVECRFSSPADNRRIDMHHMRQQGEPTANTFTYDKSCSSWS